MASQAKAQSWSSFEKLYSDNRISVEISFRYSETACDTQGKTSKYRYKISGKLYPSNKFVTWKMDYISCNGIYYTETKSINVGLNGIEDIVESLDYTFNAKKLEKEFYDASLSSYEKIEKTEKTTLITILPKKINGKEAIYKGESTTLSISGGQLELGAKWQWYEGNCDGNLIGYGESITIIPKQNTTYYLKAVSKDSISTCLSHNVTVRNDTKLPSLIYGQNNICNGEKTQLSFSDGILGDNAEWVWFEISCLGKEIGTGQSISVSPNSSTTYYLKAIGKNGSIDCISKSIIVETSSSKPTSISASNTNICDGESIKLSVNGGFLGEGAKWIWYESSILTYNKIGEGKTIEVRPISTMKYFVRAEGSCNKTEDVYIDITMTLKPKDPNGIKSNLSIYKGKKTILQVDNSYNVNNNWVWTLGNCKGKKIGTGESITYKFKEPTLIGVVNSNRCDTSKCFSQTFYPIRNSVNRKKSEPSKTLLLGFDIGIQSLSFIPKNDSANFLGGLGFVGGFYFYPLFKKNISIGLSADYSIGTFLKKTSPIDVESKSNFYSIFQPKIEIAAGIKIFKILASYSNKMYSEEFKLKNSSSYINSYRQDNIGIGFRLGSSYRNSKGVFFDVSYLITRKYDWSWDSFNWKFKTNNEWKNGVSTSIWIHNIIKIEGEYHFKDIHSEFYNNSFKVGIKYNFNRYF